MPIATNRQEAKTAIEQLVERFARNLEAYKQPAYKEARVRAEFVDPFFEALGWDVRNVRGYAEPYRDVVIEDAVEVEGQARAPDYSFRVGGVRKFFVEVKKPAVAVRADLGPAYQLRRYAWSAGLPLSTLTDFEEFAAYECRQRPKALDSAAVSRILYVTYGDYLDRFDDLYGVFAREAVLQGSFDRYVADATRQRGTTEVDHEFLKEIEGWREALARNIALRNPALSVPELNFAVQRTIDRIIFLRMAEDRGIEPYKRLLGITGAANIYAALCDLYRLADERYNAGLFDLRADTLTRTLSLDDRVLKPILEKLYYPHSPYVFQVLPVEVLGQVYEQFLGKVIRLTPAHQAKIEEKPEVKKAGGVYYTPEYIVDYIVQQTVGKLIEGQTPAQIGRLRMLDPACGSGSFLVGAYERLLDYHLEWYTKNDPEKHARGARPAICPGPKGEWRLTTAEKKRILLNNIYGVDIDRQAVEVTKLSLLLKVLEGETGDTISPQLALLRERALPDLDHNIKCGNSLIGPDYFEGREPPSDEELRRVNPFDWGREFPEVFPLTQPSPHGGEGSDGGFDAVIGNPPYVRIQTMKEWAPTEVEYYKRAYRAASKGNYDIYVAFVERGLSLLNERGLLGFILPHKFFNAQYGQPLRTLLSEGRHLSQVVHFGDQQVFEGPTTYTCLLFLAKGGREKFEFVQAHDLAAWRAGTQVEGVIGASKAEASEWNFVVGCGSDLFERLQAMPTRLGMVSHLFVGVQTDADDVYIVELDHTECDTAYCRSKFTGTVHPFEAGHVKSLVKGSVNIRRYHLSNLTKYLIFPYRTVGNTSVLIPAGDYATQFPQTWAYLRECRTRLTQRNRGRMSGSDWYGYVYRKNHVRIDSRKLLVPSLARTATAAPDMLGQHFFVGSGGGGGGGYGIALQGADDAEYPYMLGLLNSRLSTYILRQVTTPFRGGYLALNKQYIEQLPIRTIDFSDPADVARHDRLVALVERMLELHKRLAAATLADDKALYRRQIEATDRQIDALVYELYGLTDEEIAIVEGEVR